MKNNKGLIRDVRPQVQPPNTYPFGKNGIQNYLQDTILNEQGFTLQSAQIPGKVMGVVETDEHPIIFSTDNTVSYIGLFNRVDGSYTPKFNDSATSFKLNFNTDWYIKGEFQRNYKNETIVVWTDKNNPMYTFNIDDPDDFTELNDFLFFLQATPPQLEVSADVGGTLIRGAYYVFGRYVRNDGAETAYIVNSEVVSISNETTGIGDKLILIKVTKVDTRYDKIQFAIVSKIDGQMRAVELEPIPLPKDPDAELTYTYTGNEITTPATVTDILTQPAVYRTVGALGQLNDSLYIADLTTQPSVQWQKYANLIRVEFISTMVDVMGQKEDLKKGELKTFMHGEVYALYARLLLTDGTRSRAFLISGRPPGVGDTDPSAKGTTVGITTKKFQVENTIPYWAPAPDGGFKGGMGYWENETEMYPDHEDFDSTAIGGEDLRGKPVRHHRFPTLDFTHQFYGGEHGRTQLDRLGIVISNVIIPADLQQRVSGIEILYAKRTGTNMTVVGQSLLEYECYGNSSGVGGPIYTSGGNWGSVNKQRGDRGSINDYDAIRPRTDYARFHPFEMLFFKPSVSVSYVRPMLYMRMNNVRSGDNYFSDGMHPDRGGFLGFKLDYTSPDATQPTTPFNGDILKMEEGKYVPANILFERRNNLRCELTYAGKITNFPRLAYDYNTYNIGRGRNWGAPTPAGNVINYEENVLCSLNVIRPNVYNTFYLQSLVTTSRVFPLDGQAFTVYGGDCFVCDYTYHTFGHNNNETPPALGDGFVWAGIRAVRRIVCISSANINARFKIAGNPASEWYPDSPILKNNNQQYIMKITPGTEPNQFGYSKDSNTLNEISNAVPWSPDEEEVLDFPYRIHRGGKVSRTGKLRSWQTLLPLDFYEAQKNMGRIINLCGINDRLLIHHENALFVTQDKAKLESDIISVTLGSGDIFQFEPQEALYSKLGYAGTQHDLACVLTPLGYVFIDAKQGQMFLYDGALKLINNGLNNFFQDYARLQEKNVFIGNGVTLGWDPEFKRILLTLKNMMLSPDVSGEVRYDYQETPEYFATLIPGVSLVYKDGRIQRFLGPNQSPYQCPTQEPPILGDYTFSVDERAPAGTFIGTIAATAGTQPYTYFIMNPSPYVELGATSGEIRVSSPPNYALAPVIVLTVKVVDANGLEDTGTVTINVNHIPQGPSLQDYEFTVDEAQPPIEVGTLIGVAGTNPSLVSYQIIAGDPAGDFSLTTASNQATLRTTRALDYENLRFYELTVRVTDGAGMTATGVVRITVRNVDEPPIFEDQTFTIYDTHPQGSGVGTIEGAEDPDSKDEGVITYEIVFTDAEGVFSVDLETLVITHMVGAELDPLVKDRYTIRMRAIDEFGMEDIADITILVKYDPAQYVFSEYGYNCVGGDCPAGSSPSPEGDYCITVEDQPAIPPVSGEQMVAQPRSNGAYTNYGTYIYSPGFNVNGTGARTRIPLSNPWWYNPWTPPVGNTVNGPLNRTGLWATRPIGATDDPPFNTWIGFTRYVNIPASKTYYVAVAGDNRCRIRLNGVDVVTQNENALATQSGAGIDVAFKEWHVYPVDLPSGPNILTLQGLNTGSVGAFGCEIYDNTKAELEAATSYADLTVIFSTKDFRNGPIDAGEGSYTCANPGFEPIDTGGGEYICRKITRVERTTAVKTITSVIVTTVRYSGRTIAILPNAPGQTYDGRPVPYFPPVVNSEDCSGTVYTNAATSRIGNKNDCSPGQRGVPITYNIPAGKYASQVSQEDADAKATTDLDFYTQIYANENGGCEIDPNCLQPDAFQLTDMGPICDGGAGRQIEIRTISNEAIQAGIRVELQWIRSSDSALIYKQTSLPASGSSSTILMCVPTLSIANSDTMTIRAVYC